MDKTEMEFAIICFNKWLWIREKWEESEFPPRSLTQIGIDAEHSSLLRRLLEGKEPLEYPPPRSFSYPNYSLAENDDWHTSEFFIHKEDDNIRGYPLIAINQMTWRIEKEIEPDKKFILSYREDCPCYEAEIKLTEFKYNGIDLKDNNKPIVKIETKDAIWLKMIKE